MKKTVLFRYVTIKAASFVTCVIALFSGCDPAQVSDPDDPDNSISEVVSGVYSGNGTFMPNHVLISKTEVCSVPAWESLVKKGTASAIVSAVNDSTVNIALNGEVYLTNLSRNFVLKRSGNQVSDQAGKLVFYISTRSMQIDVTSEGFYYLDPECKSNSKYYFVSVGPVGTPPYPRFNYYSVGHWEFTGNNQE